MQFYKKDEFYHEKAHFSTVFPYIFIDYDNPVALRMRQFFS